MLPPILALLTVAGPVVVHPAVAPDAALTTEAQWRAIAACPRLVVGKNKEGFGTAVVVGHKNEFAFLLTSAHVVEATQPLAIHAFTIDSYPQPARVLPGATVLLRLEKPDVALVRVAIGDDPLPTLKLAGPGQRPKRFPFAAVSVGAPFGGPPAARAENVSAKILKRLNDEPEAFFWQVEAKPEKGRSGGPLLDAESRVIGICAATANEKGYFTHLDEILAGLKRGGYEWLWK